MHLGTLKATLNNYQNNYQHKTSLGNEQLGEVDSKKH